MNIQSDIYKNYTTEQRDLDEWIRQCLTYDEEEHIQNTTVSQEDCTNLETNFKAPLSSAEEHHSLLESSTCTYNELTLRNDIVSTSLVVDKIQVCKEKARYPNTYRKPQRHIPASISTVLSISNTTSKPALEDLMITVYKETNGNMTEVIRRIQEVYGNRMTRYSIEKYWKEHVSKTVTLDIPSKKKYFPRTKKMNNFGRIQKGNDHEIPEQVSSKAQNIEKKRSISTPDQGSIDNHVIIGEYITSTPTSTMALEPAIIESPLTVPQADLIGIKFKRLKSQNSSHIKC